MNGEAILKGAEVGAGRLGRRLSRQSRYKLMEAEMRAVGELEVYFGSKVKETWSLEG